MRDRGPEATADDLLEWYDRHARVLPWRVPPGAEERPDPYRVWLSEVMLQQTTVPAVKAYFHRFTLEWPTVKALAAAEDADVMAAWAGLGYYARARNLLKCAREVAQMGQFPDTLEGLLGLPGIGPYTAAAIAAIAFDRPETVVDGNVERVMARLHGVETPLPTSKPELVKLARALTPQERTGDYAQAVMDLGATICTPRNPACGICPWREPCVARFEGNAAELPRKLPKKEKPTRLGIVYLGRREDGAWLLETRPASGLLGGMLGWPGSDWAEAEPVAMPPAPGDWQTLNGEVRHTFTHFHLRLRPMVARLPQATDPRRGHFVEKARFRSAHLPTVMRKAFTLSKPWFEEM
ncbi:A/G-specific adenine glycosylase [Mangrovicoccus sp. HB161399]|uniref:A/G-specific adenine glycosylase n=1 Tax=Mangrovicoccus sp. HB161399 TaxID=2720392 RepID=UPI001551A4E9|nr:A/G-specific adenine glycosylase [Mangrovicoccus sp. HB161399]